MSWFSPRKGISETGLWLAKAEDVVLGTATFALAATVMYGVLIRYILPTAAQMAWTEEISRLLLVWIVWYGAFRVMRKEQHFVIDILVSHLDKTRVPLAILVDLIVLGLLVMVSKEALVLVGEQMNYNTTTMIGLPVGLWSLSVLVGGVLMVCYLLVHLILNFQLLFQK